MLLTKLIKITAYDAFQAKGVNLTPCESLDSLFLQVFENFDKNFKGLQDFHNYLRYATDLETGDNVEDYPVIAVSGKYKLVAV